MSKNHRPMNDDPVASGTPALQLLSRATRDGAADAREAASKTWEATTLFARRFLYTGCYSLSYGVVFPAMLLARAIPRDNMMVQGMIQGASDASKKADEVLGKSIESHLILPASLTGDLA